MGSGAAEPNMSPPLIYTYAEGGRLYMQPCSFLQARSGKGGASREPHGLAHLTKGQPHLSSAASRDREAPRQSSVLALSSHSWTVQSLVPHLGLEEVLGTLDALCGDINLGEAGQDVQATVFLQLPCCRLAEDQKELRTRAQGSVRDNGDNVPGHTQAPAQIPLQKGCVLTCRTGSQDRRGSGPHLPGLSC